MQKNQLIDLQEHFERYCNVLPVFGFNSSKYGINLIKLFLLPMLVNERDVQPTVIEKAIQFGAFKFGDIPLLDIMNFLGGAPVLTPSSDQRDKGFLFLRMVRLSREIEQQGASSQ